MRQIVAPFSPIDRRRFVQLAAGSLAFGPVGCGRRGDRASNRGSTVTIAYNPSMELANIVRADAPVTFLCPKVDLELVHRRVRGLSSPWRAEPLQFMEELWLEDER